MKKIIRISMVMASIATGMAANGQASVPAPSAAMVAAEAAAPVIPAGKNTVDALPWMTGCWQSKSTRDGSTVNETWLSPRGGSMLGMGQTYLGSKTLGWEAMRVYDEAGAVKLWLRPGARNELTLTLEAAGDNFATFAVKEGETTTKLRYERKSPTDLVATFRLEQGENRRGADFTFTKAECAETFAAAAKDAPTK